VAEESTELVEASSNKLISRQVLMAEEGEDDGNLPIVALDMISKDEATANAGNENDADREARRARNRARAVWRRRVNERMRSMLHELDAEFAVVSERGFRTPVANIARVTAILERSNDPNLRQALRYAQRAWIQLDQQNPASTIREELVGNTAARLTVERQAAVLNLSAAITMKMPAGVRPLVGGSSHLREATRNRPIIGILQKTCARESMKDTMYDP
jgi:hypothetical protein